MDTLKNFIIEDSFWGRYEKLITETVIPYQEKILKDEIPGIEKSHAVENFRQAAAVLETGKASGEFYGMVFQDSDVAKWIEAAAYSLVYKKNSKLEKSCDEIIDLVCKSQHKNGYVNTYFTVKEPGRQWTNLQEAHELYCAGHMMEAAVAYYESTGKKSLLDCMSKMADHIYDHFITNKNPGYPGHPEIELALIRMYKATQKKEYKELAEHFINIRGVDSDYYKTESERREWKVWGRWDGNKEYTLCHLPLREQKDAVGHAVRAVYLYSGMAAVAKETDDKTLINACKNLWFSITRKRMYITGAIGSAYEGESFTKDYHLPNETAYGESCASVGLIFFASRMFDIEKKGEYCDVMEKALYNCVLAGVQLDGKRFFYVNVLESLPGISGQAVSLRHAIPERPNWFSCACCPPNIARLITSIGMYAWKIEKDKVFSILYIGGTLDLTNEFSGKINVKTDYPYGNTVTYKFKPEEKKIMKMIFVLRIPEWSEETKIYKNDKELIYDNKDGFAYIEGPFGLDDIIKIELDMTVKKMYPSPKISADSGKICFMKGPIVYCAEGADNSGSVINKIIKQSSIPKIQNFNHNELCGIDKIKVEGIMREDDGFLYKNTTPKEKDCIVTFIPYYSWANRGINEMRVWVPEK